MEINVQLSEGELRLIRQLLNQRQIEQRKKETNNEEWFDDLISRINPYNEKL